MSAFDTQEIGSSSDSDGDRTEARGEAERDQPTLKGIVRRLTRIDARFAREADDIERIEDARQRDGARRALELYTAAQLDALCAQIDGIVGTLRNGARPLAMIVGLAQAATATVACARCALALCDHVHGLPMMV